MPDASHGKRLFDGLLDYPLSTTDGTTRDYVFYFAENSGRTPVSGRLSTTISRRALNGTVVVFPLRFRRRRSLLGHPFARRYRLPSRSAHQ